MTTELGPHKLRRLIPEEEIFSRIDEMGAALAAKYEGQNPILLRIKDGADIFADRLELAARANGLEFETASITVKSMEGTETTGMHTVTEEYSGPDPHERILVLVEDIIDAGRTIDFVLEHMQQFAPSIIRTIALFTKPERRDIAVDVEDAGFEVFGFVVGVNLDWNNHYRELVDLWLVQFPPHSIIEWLKNLKPKKSRRLHSPKR